MSQRLPALVSLAQLHSLENSLGGESTVCRGFVSTYIDMWAGRFQRLACAVQAGNLEDAMDAALSLSTSSHMVGAERLELYTEELIGTLRSGRLGNASLALPSIGECGQQTVTRLEECYVKRA